MGSKKYKLIIINIVQELPNQKIAGVSQLFEPHLGPLIKTTSAFSDSYQEIATVLHTAVDFYPKMECIAFAYFHHFFALFGCFIIVLMDCFSHKHT